MTSRPHRAAAPGAAARAATALTGLALVLSACSHAVEATAPAQATSGACTAAAAHWPASVGGKTRRETSAASPAVRAWGDPAVIARCGVASPGPTTDQCVEVDGVDWVAHRLSDGVRFTTYGRSPAIEVLVPHDYAPEPLLLPAFSAAARAIPQSPTHRCR